MPYVLHSCSYSDDSESVIINQDVNFQVTSQMEDNIVIIHQDDNISIISYHPGTDNVICTM
jgi:hypothetical protein